MIAGRFELHPLTRIVAVVLALFAITIIRDVRLLLIFEGMLLPAIYLSGSIRLLGNFVLVVGVPMSLIFGLDFYLSNYLSYQELLVQLMIVVRLICYTTVFQLLLIIPLKYVPMTFRQWGFKGQNLLTVTGSYFVWVDIVNRSERILLARLDSGYVNKRTLISNLVQIPYIVLPLVIGIMRTATVRSETWEQKKFIERIETIRFQVIPVNWSYNFLLILFSALWLGVAIYFKIK